eukprot:14080839-Heterocapsa_arctica.AAC.1
MLGQYRHESPGLGPIRGTYQPGCGGREVEHLNRDRTVQLCLTVRMTDLYTCVLRETRGRQCSSRNTMADSKRRATASVRDVNDRQQTSLYVRRVCWLSL